MYGHGLVCAVYCASLLFFFIRSFSFLRFRFGCRAVRVCARVAFFCLALLRAILVAQLGIDLVFERYERAFQMHAQMAIQQKSETKNDN